MYIGISAAHGMTGGNLAQGISQVLASLVEYDGHGIKTRGYESD
jgi:hypothetical protein